MTLCNFHRGNLSFCPFFFFFSLFSGFVGEKNFYLIYFCFYYYFLHSPILVKFNYLSIKSHLVGWRKKKLNTTLLYKVLILNNLLHYILCSYFKTAIYTVLYCIITKKKSLMYKLFFSSLEVRESCLSRLKPFGRFPLPAAHSQSSGLAPISHPSVGWYMYLGTLPTRTYLPPYFVVSV